MPGNDSLTLKTYDLTPLSDTFLSGILLAILDNIPSLGIMADAHNAIIKVFIHGL